MGVHKQGSAEKEWVRIRPVNSHVAIRAILKSRRTHVVRLRQRLNSIPFASERTGPVVTLEAHGKDHRPAEEARVWRAVRAVADLAAFDSNGSVFESKRPTFVGVALEAGFFVGERLRDPCRPCRHAPRGSGSAVWIVAIRARHEALIDTVLERHRELASHLNVAAVAQFRLRPGEEIPGSGRFVDGMALNAIDIGIGMH